MSDLPRDPLTVLYAGKMAIGLEPLGGDRGRLTFEGPAAGINALLTVLIEARCLDAGQITEWLHELAKAGS